MSDFKPTLACVPGKVKDFISSFISGRPDARGPNYHPDQDDLEVQVVPSPVVKEKMSSCVKEKTLEFLLRSLVAKTLQKNKVDAASDVGVYVEPLLERTRAELEGIDFDLDPKKIASWHHQRTTVPYGCCSLWAEPPPAPRSKQETANR